MNAVAVRVPALPERPRTTLVLAAVFSLALHAAFAALLWPSSPAVPEAVGNAIAVDVVVRGPDLTPKSGTRAGTAAAAAAPPNGAETAPPPKPAAKPEPEKRAAEKPAPAKKPALKKAKPRPKKKPRQTAARPSSAAKSGQASGKATGKTGATGADRIASLAPSAGVPGPVSRGAAPLGSNPVPVYPERARTRGWEGRVLLSVKVTADGRAASVIIAASSGHSILDRAARKAVKRWRFIPAMKAGVKSTSTVTVPVRFVLR